MIEVTVLFLEGGHASTAVGPLEVFHDAGRLWNQLMGDREEPRFRVRTASIDGRSVRAEGGYRLEPETALDAIEATDLVFVPAAGLDLDAVLERNARVVDALRRLHAGGARVAGVCSGVVLLAEAGLLDGRPATTHWALEPEMRRRHPAVHWQPERIVTGSAGVYCGGGVHAALDLALHLVEEYGNREVALGCARSLLLEMPRACQAGFALLPVGRIHEDEAIRRAEEWILQHCREEIRFEALAGQLGMSPRNFIRRFKKATGSSPVDYLQRLRVQAARRLLETGRIGIQELSEQVGYGDAAFFRNVFKRHTGLSPIAYRRKFGEAR